MDYCVESECVECNQPFRLTDKVTRCGGRCKVFSKIKNKYLEGYLCNKCIEKNKIRAEKNSFYKVYVDYCDNCIWMEIG